ncbi:epoxyqueuosine reductase [Methanoregula sp.]|uniref:epoxyqueuosine reductase n=1 Tax=Methanoregula sp. TaxID=2052170 RepID=UPI002BEDEE9C|nr:epoxyqueuosine reductase [Methanoregula sp.]HVP95540.1 epoxyqueuosine reductase [Methanoregula sp.]
MSSILRRQILRKCTSMDVPLVGFAPADRWNHPPFEPWVPEPFRPAAIFPGTKTVIVLGFPISLPILDTAPSIWYHELYHVVNEMLDSCGYRLALFLTGKGYPSVWVPRDGYGSIDVLKEKPVAFFSHRHAAFCAGLGNFGENNMLLTPHYGPRARFVSILTTAEIPGDPLIEEPLCTHCRRCTTICPVSAIGGGEYPENLTDKHACAVRAGTLKERYLSPCGCCIRVCPVGDDRHRYNREDMRMYDDNSPLSGPYRSIRDHVRSYGSR